MNVTPEHCCHLTVSIVREIHAEVIARHGGAGAVREIALLESAVAAPQASMGGQSPYADLIEVAAAYLFYLCQNHPFMDGNKRTALGACIVFLRLNGMDPMADGPKWEKWVLSVAAGEIDWEGATRLLREFVVRG
jgi:death-on-curing protein